MTNALETVALAADRAGYGLGAPGTGFETARDGLAAFLSTDYEGDCNRRIATIDEFGEYFDGLTRDRLAHPTDDLATVIANGQVTGYFLTRISFMMDKGKANALQIPLPELTTDELFSLLIGNKAIDISNAQSFDVTAFRSDLKKRMNERLGGDYVADVLIEQLDYLSKEETHGGASIGRRTVKPVKIVQDAAKDKVPVE